MSSANLPLGFVAKVGRAKEHLDALKSSIESATVGGECYVVVKEANPDAGEYVFRIRINKQPPITEWSLLIGDCLHNTRSALDHLFWALLLKKNTGGLTKGTSDATFPITREWATFNGRKKKLEGWVGQQALAMLEGLQPYKSAGGWNKSPLMFLHDFDITDKHKLLLPAVHILNSGQIQTQTVENRTVIFDGSAVLLALEDNAIIANLKYRTPQDVVDVNYHVALDVVFEGQPGPLRVVPTLERLIEVVEGVGNDFIPLL